MSGVGEQLNEIKSFARHETFYPRYGWLTKITDKHDILYLSNNHNELGVGKNMFLSMKFWGQALKLVIKEEGKFYKTDLNKILFGHNNSGLDPYVERYETLWVLFYESLQPTSLLPAWRSMINSYSSEYFNLNSAELYLKNRARTEYPEVSESSIRKDVMCFTSMFATKNIAAKSDEFILSPFTELGYIVSDIDKDAYRFVNGSKPTLNSKVVLWSIIRHMENMQLRSITISDLCSREDSPGMVFKLSTDDISEYLSHNINNSKKLYSVLESAGEKIFSYDPKTNNSLNMLKLIYKENTNEF